MKLSVVIPVYNESNAIVHNLEEIISAIEKTKAQDFEVIVVDDGSTDTTVLEISQELGTRDCIKLISFTRNFGKEAAILAGLRQSSGDVAVVMDSDLQHPPSLLNEMITLWGEGYKVVNGCKRNRGKESIFYKSASGTFYALFQKMTGLDITGHSDYKLLDRVVVDDYCDLPEKSRFFRAAVPYMGHSSKDLFFDVRERAAGESNWTLGKLAKYSISSIASFTSMPLHLISFASMAVFVVSVVMTLIALWQLVQGIAVEGFTTIIILILFTGSIIMFSLGQIGIYLEKIYNEVKSRPSYFIDSNKSLHLEVVENRE